MMKMETNSDDIEHIELDKENSRKKVEKTKEKAAETKWEQVKKEVFEF